MSWMRDVVSESEKVAQSCLTLCDPLDYIVHGILQARTLEWVAFPFSRGSSQPRDQTQVYLHCKWILYQLSHKGSPRILKWVTYPFSRGSSQPRNQTGVSCSAGGFFTIWAIRWHALMTAIRRALYVHTFLWNGWTGVAPADRMPDLTLNSAALCLSFDIYKVGIIMLPIS